MKGMLSLLALLLIVIPVHAEDPHASSAAAYEHLANAIISINETENALVAGILEHHFAAAQSQLRDATSMKMTSPHTEAAAEEVTSIANEGGKQVQAIRQRLLQAGHHHHTDAETEEDYIWIDSKEKKALLDLAGRIGRCKDAGELAGLSKELSSLFQSAMKPE